MRVSGLRVSKALTRFGVQGFAPTHALLTPFKVQGFGPVACGLWPACGPRPAACATPAAMPRPRTSGLGVLIWFDASAQQTNRTSTPPCLRVSLRGAVALCPRRIQVFLFRGPWSHVALEPLYSSPVRPGIDTKPNLQRGHPQKQLDTSLLQLLI